MGIGWGEVLWSQVCSLLTAASWGLGPGQSEVPFSAFTPAEPSGIGSSPSARPPRPETSKNPKYLFPFPKYSPTKPGPLQH